MTGLQAHVIMGFTTMLLDVLNLDEFIRSLYDLSCVCPTDLGVVLTSV
jgi:hypothetical protein